MAKLRCPCGGAISDSGDFNRDKAVAVRDVDYSRLLSSADLESRMSASVEAFRSAGEPELHRQVMSAALDVLWSKQIDLFECPACGRIAIETAPGSCRFRFFTPESKDRSIFLVEALDESR